MSEVRCPDEIEVRGLRFRCTVHWDPATSSAAEAHSIKKTLGNHTTGAYPDDHPESLNATRDGRRVTANLTWFFFDRDGPAIDELVRPREDSNPQPGG